MVNKVKVKIGKYYKNVMKSGYVLSIRIPLYFLDKLNITDTKTLLDTKIIVENTDSIYWLISKSEKVKYEKTMRRIIPLHSKNMFILHLDSIFCEAIEVTIDEYLWVELIVDDTDNNKPKLLIYKVI